VERNERYIKNKYVERNEQDIKTNMWLK